MKIMPIAYRTVPFVLNDGQRFEEMAFQVFRLKDGNTIVRIGRNIFVFLADGRFDGTEHKCDEGADAEALTGALTRSAEHEGQPPDEPYYEPGSPGHEAETLGFPRMRGPTH
jgi:hypothetical protein